MFYQSAGIVITAYIIRYFALGRTTIAHSLASVDPDLTDAARVEGATRWQTLRLVHWPQIAPQILAGWYVVFLLCLWDVESMLLVFPPGGETLALRIFNLLHYGHNAQVNALCLALLLLALLPLALWKTWSVISAAPAFTKHETRNTLLLFPAALLLQSCSPPPANQTPIQSSLFSYVEILGTRGVGVGQFNKPRSVTVDNQDNLFAVDMTGRVQKFSPEGLFVLSWQMPQTELGKPKGMCRDCNGNIILVEPHYQRVNHFATDGKLLAQWGKRGTNAGEFTLPRAVAVNSHNEFFVSEYTTMERVQRYKWDNSAPLPADLRLGPPTLDEHPNPASSAPISFMNGFGQPGRGPGEFNRPEGLCIDGQDRLYVADSCNHRIQIFSREGKFIRAYGHAGTGKGELSYPYDICVDKAGRQYVCEFGNSRIQVFDANDKSIEIIGGPGGEPGQFSNPWGVALDSKGNLYVADSQNHRVQKFVHSNLN